MFLKYKILNNNYRIIFCPDREGVEIKKKFRSYTTIAKDLKNNYNDNKVVLVYDNKINEKIIRYLILDLKIFKNIRLISFKGSKK